MYNGGSNSVAEDAYINMWVLTLVLRLTTMRINSLHPPPLACTGLSDNLSSPALFPLCNRTVTNAQTKLFLKKKRANLKKKFFGSMKFLPLVVTQTAKTEFSGMKISNLEQIAFVISHLFCFSEHQQPVARSHYRRVTSMLHNKYKTQKQAQHCFNVLITHLVNVCRYERDPQVNGLHLEKSFPF